MPVKIGDIYKWVGTIVRYEDISHIHRQNRLCAVCQILIYTSILKKHSYDITMPYMMSQSGINQAQCFVAQIKYQVHEAMTENC